jgi:hypothetical protein
MNPKKTRIPKKIIDINFKFYFYLKELNKIKLTFNEISKMIEAYFANKHEIYSSLIAIFRNIIEDLTTTKKSVFEEVFISVSSEYELKSFIFALKLIQIKPLLLEEAKLIEMTELVELKNVPQLSLKYDTISKSKPYYTRVNGALLSLLFFDRLEQKDTSFISEYTKEYIDSLVEEYALLEKNGLAANQMFMLMFAESINQSIISDAGSSYEKRIFNVLINLGIKPDAIKKMHDQTDKSTEFDFYFELDGKSVGISAKRTLRERYKQFIKTALTTPIDLMIQITLGLDLTEEKAKTIRKHGAILFIADEIYEARDYFNKIDGIYPVSKFNLLLLKKLLSSSHKLI